MKKILLFSFVFLTYGGFAQDTLKKDSVFLGKKIINHTTYDSWKSIMGQVISNDGNWVAYEVNPQVGDGKLFLYNTATQSLDSFNRAKNANFLYSTTNFLVFKIVPPYRITRKAKLDKKKADDMPKDTLAVLDLTTKKITKLGNVKSFSVNDYTQYIIAHLNKEKKPVVKLSKRQIRKNKKNPPIELKSDGTTLVAWNPINGIQKRISNVTEFAHSAKSASCAFVVQQKGKNDSSFVYQLFDASATRDNFWTDGKFIGLKVHENNGWSKSLSWDEKGNQLAFLSSTDTSKTNKLYSLYLKPSNDTKAKLILDTTNRKIAKELTVSENGKIQFSPNGNKLFFGIAPIPKKEPKDTLLEDEKYVVDVWHWNDDRIQPEQLKQLDKDKKLTYWSYFNTSTNDIFQLENDTLKFAQFVQKGDGDIALFASEKKYRKSQTWETQVPADYYILDLKTGKSTLALEKKTHTVSLSYTGKYLLWYEPLKRDWYNMNLQTKQSVLITNRIDDNLFEDNNGMAEQPYPYGIMGWSKNDDYVYIYSEFEIWKINSENKDQISCITKNKGGELNTDLRNIKLDNEIDYIDDNYLLLKSFNHQNKREGFWAYTNGAIKPLLVEDSRITFYGKAKNSNKLLYSLMDFQTYPDLIINDLNFGSAKQISNTNPQQSAYNWGTVELVKWEIPGGQELEGLLYKPENFDETKKYPMIVYYYEKNADNLHAYKAPRPSASTVNLTEYVSNGYIIFVPDIVYKLGEPGKGAYDCIMSGTKSIVERGFIDEKNIGLQGQSWGGYQTAFMVTQTNYFKAAMAGAPVGNMTSAYGGVRWESGLLRAFQYEKGQSRIGKTLWEDREAYIRNSPVFFLDKVNTPLLLMNNDADGAVPWYQGIEIYTGLRRMEKPVWLLNYNNDQHNLTKRPNQVDLSIRMMQFFDYYLKGEAMPEWMKDGLPAVKKGKVTGYGFTK